MIRASRLSRDEVFILDYEGRVWCFRIGRDNQPEIRQLTDYEIRGEYFDVVKRLGIRDETS